MINRICLLLFMIVFCINGTLNAKIIKIIIDPQYGGEEYGPIGPDGAYSKDITLNIAKQLGEIIKERTGYQVKYTREYDENMNLEKRSSIANNEKGDIFITIGVNWSKDKTIRGFRIYNSTVQFDESHNYYQNNGSDSEEVGQIVDDLKKSVLNKYDKGVELSKLIFCNLRKKFYSNDDGPKISTFDILLEVNIPSSLILIGYISNPLDEKNMQDILYQKDISIYLFNGLQEYLRRRTED